MSAYLEIRRVSMFYRHMIKKLQKASFSFRNATQNYMLKHFTSKALIKFTSYDELLV